MKIGLFSDSHYCNEERKDDTRMCSLSIMKLREAFEDFKIRKPDLIMCMGDLCDKGKYDDKESSRRYYAEIMDIIKSANIPFLFVTGNHEFLIFEKDELSEVTDALIPPFVYDTEEFRIIGLDANYSTDMNHFSPKGFDWTDTNLPDEQLRFLKEKLGDTDKECIVAVHEPIDSKVKDWYSVNNAGAVRDIIEKSGKVKLVIQGHVHEYGDYTENGIRYITVVGMCEGEKNRYMFIEKKGNSTEVCLCEKSK